jgi:Rrf2 family protein
MCCLQDPGGDYVPGQKVAAWIEAPVPYLLKIFSKLARARLVATKRSRSGGIILLRPANEITLEQITLAMEGDAWRTTCLLHFATCSPETPCPVHAPWTAGRIQILQALQSLTLDQMKGCLRPQRLAPPGQAMALQKRHNHNP